MNAWLGGFESILRRMISNNFNWFLYTMLFYHTRHVLERQKNGSYANDHNNSGDEENVQDNVQDNE